jgi:hypothetical protein
MAIDSGGGFLSPRRQPYQSPQLPQPTQPTQQAQPIAQPSYDTSLFGGDYQTMHEEPRQAEYSAPYGGSPTVPATAQPVTPTAIARQPGQSAEDQAIAAAYRTYLGRDIGEGEYDYWRGVSGFQQGIAGSPEAQAYAQRNAAPQQTQQPTALDPRATMVTSGPPPGFEASKWADTTHTTDKYVTGRMLSQGASIPEIVNTLNASGMFGPYRQISGDKIVDRNGTIIDLYKDFGGQNQIQWLEVGREGGGSAGGGGNFSGGGGGGVQIPAWLQQTFGSGGGGGGLGAYLPGGFSQNGADPMSQLIDSGLAGLIASGGSTGRSDDVMAKLMAVINGGGVGPDTMQQLIGAREAAALGQQSMLEDARAALAGQGGLSAPGVEQGSTTAAVQRISEAIAPEFADALRDIYGKALDESNENFMGALQMATGMADDQAKNLLQALGQGTSRQQALAGIALDTLAQNMDWNKFLATHSLDTAKLMEDIQNGRLDRVVQLMKLFIDGAGNSQQGYY